MASTSRSVSSPSPRTDRPGQWSDTPLDHIEPRRTATQCHNRRSGTAWPSGRRRTSWEVRYGPPPSGQRLLPARRSRHVDDVPGRVAVGTTADRAGGGVRLSDGRSIGVGRSASGGGGYLHVAADWDIPAACSRRSAAEIAVFNPACPTERRDLPVHAPIQRRDAPHATECSTRADRAQARPAAVSAARSLPARPISSSCSSNQMEWYDSTAGWARYRRSPASRRSRAASSRTR